MDWEGIFDYIKSSAYMKPYAGGTTCTVLKIRKSLGKTSGNQSVGYDASGEIVFTEYFRVYCLGAKRSESCSTPRNQPHLRYVIDGPPSDKNWIIGAVKNVH
jgi:hypothetical protein